MSDLISRAEAINAVTTWGTSEERIGNVTMAMVSVKRKVTDILSELPSADEYVPHKACFDCMERGTGMCKGTIQEQSWCPYVAKINAEPNKTEHDSCSDCRWEPFKEDADPCKNCKRNYTDKYETLFARLEIIEDRNELLHTIQSEFEAEEARAFADQTKGLKEHAVWNKAIRILEEYIV